MKEIYKNIMKNIKKETFINYHLIDMIFRV